MFVPGDPRFDETLELAHLATSSALSDAQRERWRALCSSILGELRSKSAISERRRAVRGTASLQVSVLAPEDLCGTAVTSTVSSGGLSLRSRTPVQIGQSLQLSVSIPERKKPVFVSGEVVWSRTGEVGVEFVQLPQSDRELLEAVAVKALLVYVALE